MDNLNIRCAGALYRTFPPAEARLKAARARYDRLTHLIDKAYEEKLEGAIDDDFFQRQRDTEWRVLVETMARLNRADRSSMDLAVQVLELGDRPHSLYSQALTVEKHPLLGLACLNRGMGGGKLRVSLREPWSKQRSLVDAMPKEKTLLDESRRACPEWWAILDEVRTFATAHERWEDGVLERFRGVAERERVTR